MSLYNYFTSKSKTPSKTTVQVAVTQVNLTSTEEEEVLSALENGKCFPDIKRKPNGKVSKKSFSSIIVLKFR